MKQLLVGLAAALALALGVSAPAGADSWDDLAPGPYYDISLNGKVSSMVLVSCGRDCLQDGGADGEGRGVQLHLIGSQYMGRRVLPPLSGGCVVTQGWVIDRDGSNGVVSGGCSGEEPSHRYFKLIPFS